MNNILRALALTLVVTGAVASTHIAKTSPSTAGTRMSDLPVPTCAPDDPNACGICQLNGSCATN